MSLELTDRERQILGIVQKEGTMSPTDVASKLGISQAGASQALQRMMRKGVLARKAAGKRAYYQHVEEDVTYLYLAYSALSQVWAYIMALRLSKEKMKKAKEARETLERLLAEKAK